MTLDEENLLWELLDLPAVEENPLTTDPAPPLRGLKIEVVTVQGDWFQ